MEGIGYFAQTGTDERTFVVRDVNVVFNILDNGGRRAGIERRRFSYSDHIPERRRGVDRRCGKDRRLSDDCGLVPKDRRQVLDGGETSHHDSTSVFRKLMDL